MEYHEFLSKKEHLSGEFGFSPTYMPDILFDFQRALVEWACRKGRAAIFADCGLGKTFIQLVWAQNVVEQTNGRVLILTPLAVAFQTERESQKIGVEVEVSRKGWYQKKIVVTNYEKLHLFDPNDFEGVVCDESSILKNPDGFTKESIIRFIRKRPYRLLCTATAAPNDYIELGTSSECLGYMGFSDMLNKFFKKSKKTYSRKIEHQPGVYRFRGHAEEPFWRWVCSWARALRKPSDMGYDDNGFILPKLDVREHTVKAKTLLDGYLFELPAIGIKEQRNELRRTIEERCQKASHIINSHKYQSIAWCHLNEEGNILEKLIPDSVNVEGNDSEECKEEAFKEFSKGTLRVLVSKPSIAGFGMNWQQCHHMTFFPSHSYEQYYQAVRRCWRFGQKNPVLVDIISTEGQKRVALNMRRKSDAADAMFENLVGYMSDELRIIKNNIHTNKMEVASWLKINE